MRRGEWRAANCACKAFNAFSRCDERVVRRDFGNAPIDVERGREIICGIDNHIPVRPGADGMTIAELLLRKCHSPQLESDRAT